MRNSLRMLLMLNVTRNISFNSFLSNRIQNEEESIWMQFFVRHFKFKCHQWRKNSCTECFKCFSVASTVLDNLFAILVDFLEKNEQFKMGEKRSTLMNEWLVVVAKLKLTVVTLEKIYVDDDSTMSRHDRTGDHQSRVKMSQDLAAAINDGLYDYEDELWDPSDDDAWVRTSPPPEFWCTTELLSFFCKPNVFLLAFS